MTLSTIHVRRVNNWTYRFQKLGLFLDGVYTQNVSAGNSISFSVQSGKKHVVQMGFNDKAYTNDSHEIYFEDGKEYFFEFGIFIGGEGFNLDYHGNYGWDESGAAPITKGIRAIKNILK